MPYRYFYDCEFIEDGRTIDLVSIGVVDEHGREFYAVSTEFDPTPALPWVRRNVLDRLPSPGHPAWRSRQRIRDDLYEFLVEPLRREDPGPASGASASERGRRTYEIELWAWYAAYDHVVLAQLWGRMPDLPREIPRFTKDLRQLWDERGRPPLPPSTQRHDALVDARHNLARWRAMQNHRSG
ncbi:MAG: polyadenylate-specific 3'-exoribonuclease AS [Micromonosporaceae bacterium]|nr:polyadenylate-specific 3'-exoribonuclease AS [Micromonosporaceae bacterium]